LRELRRRADGGGQASVLEEGWSLFPVPVSALKGRPTWRLPTPRAERTLAKLSQSGLPTVADLFDIAQGIQTGLNSVFLLTPEELGHLPAKERQYFRQATMTDSIQNGRIIKPYWVFFPHSEAGALFTDEHAVRQALPRYFQQYLEPNRDKLASRATILQSQRSDWSGLMRPREWSLRSTASNGSNAIAEPEA
jgi:adenine-specific DNA-methyltransferase